MIKSPEISISFIEKAKTIFERAERGVVGLVLRDDISELTDRKFTVQLAKEIPESLSDFNKEQIKLALLGNQTAPKKIVCFVMDNDEEAVLADEYDLAKEFIESEKINYLAIPTVSTDGKLSDIVSFIKDLRSENKRIQAVLPFQTQTDSEGIIGCDFTAFTSEATHTATSGKYTAEEYCSRIAGLIAGTPFTQSITYATLPDLTDCNRLTKSEQDTAVGAGKLVLMNDGEKVKVVRGVNTLQTTTDTKGESFKKIKIVIAMDLIYDDLMKTIRDTYIGKFNNDLDDKKLLVDAVNKYFEDIARDGVITKGECSIDFDAQRDYLITKGFDVVEMTEQEILEEKTGSFVFLTGNVTIPDAIEDVKFPIYI